MEAAAKPKQEFLLGEPFQIRELKVGNKELFYDSTNELFLSIHIFSAPPVTCFIRRILHHCKIDAVADAAAGTTVAGTAGHCLQIAIAGTTVSGTADV